MVSGTRPDGGGGQVISVRIRRTIQSIREIVGNHSDADIYAVLKETNMDPNETAQKLLNQDPFHEVRRKRDKRKELTGFKLAVDSKKHTESMHWEKSNRSMDFNARRGGFTRSYVPDTRINREFRIVRDNRVNQNLNKDAKSELSQHSSGNEQVKSNISEKRLTGVLNDKKLSNSGILDSHGISKDMNVLNHENDLDPVGRRRALLPEEIRTITQSTSSDPHSVVPNSSLINASFSTNSAIGMYSSSSDPVHVPSPASRSAGTVGAIRREVGAVGLKKHSSGVQGTKSVVSNDSHSAPFTGKVILLTESIELSGDLTTNTKSSQLNHVPMPDTIVPTTSNSRAGVQYSSKQHLQIFSHQRAMQPNMEWKPKSQKLKTDSSSTTETSSIFPSSNGNSFSSNLVDTIDLSHKLSDVHIQGDQHVIIPLHLRVPESECTQFTFGSFGAEFDTGKGFISTNQAIESVEQSKVEPSGSNSASVPVEPNDEISAKVGHLVDCQSGISSRSTSLASAEELERPSSGSNEPLDPQNIENYADIGLVGSHSPPYSSQQSQRMQDMTNMPNFSGSLPNHLTYNSQVGYATPFFQTTLEDNVRGQILTCTPETICSHATSSNSSTAVAITQQQYPASQQQQQAVAQLYPQVHIPHYPNFMPYRHIFSPVYVPPMAMPNYSSNPAFAHPTNGNNYLLMAGGGSHLPAGGMKYAPSQYKPLPAGSPTAYGNYPSPAAFGISTPSAVGATGLDELTRIKYKDNNIYVPNQQAEASDMWIQTPRELPGLQSTPYYNLSGHAAHPTAFVSAHAAAAAAAASGHAPFNAVAAAAQPSPVQYPTMYHPPQPASIAGPQHLIHQQVASAVGVATAGGPQVGTFQQSQLGRLNWTASF